MRYRAIRNNFCKGRLYEAGEIVETAEKMNENFECIDAPKPEKTKKAGKTDVAKPVDMPVDVPAEQAE